jgi:hypothetical protein
MTLPAIRSDLGGVMMKKTFLAMAAVTGVMAAAHAATVRESLLKTMGTST